MGQWCVSAIRKHAKQGRIAMTATVTIQLRRSLLLVVAFPVLLTLAVSFGPVEWPAAFLGPFKRYEFILLVLVGGVTALRSHNAPLRNTLFVGLIGGLGMFILAFAVEASPQRGFASAVFEYVVLSVAWCSAGAIGATLLRGNRRAL